LSRAIKSIAKARGVGVTQARLNPHCFITDDNRLNDKCINKCIHYKRVHRGLTYASKISENMNIKQDKKPAFKISDSFNATTPGVI